MRPSGSGADRTAAPPCGDAAADTVPPATKRALCCVEGTSPGDAGPYEDWPRVGTCCTVWFRGPAGAGPKTLTSLVPRYAPEGKG
ncbi:hypothetical protein GCM10027194_28800 [Thalassiella azotivora]